MGLGSSEEDEVGNIVNQCIKRVIVGELGKGSAATVAEMSVHLHSEGFALVASGSPLGDGGEGVVDEGGEQGVTLVSASAKVGVRAAGSSDEISHGLEVQGDGLVANVASTEVVANGHIEGKCGGNHLHCLWWD